MINVDSVPLDVLAASIAKRSVARLGYLPVPGSGVKAGILAAVTASAGQSSGSGVKIEAK